MALSPREIRDALGHFVTGVTVVTTKDKSGSPSGITANAFTSLSLDPPMVLICVDKKAQCYSCFEESGLFAVNVLSEEQEELSRRFATKGIDKFEETKWHMGTNSIPLLDDTIGYIECRVINNYEGGDHTIFVGEILGASAQGDRPLVFFKGQYYYLPKA